MSDFHLEKIEEVLQRYGLDKEKFYNLNPFMQVKLHNEMQLLVAMELARKFQDRSCDTLANTIRQFEFDPTNPERLKDRSVRGVGVLAFSKDEMDEYFSANRLTDTIFFEKINSIKNNIETMLNFFLELSPVIRMGVWSQEEQIRYYKDLVDFYKVIKTDEQITKEFHERYNRAIEAVGYIGPTRAEAAYHRHSANSFHRMFSRFSESDLTYVHNWILKQMEK